MGEVYKITIDGVEVAAKTPFTMANPRLYRLNRDPIARQTVLKECMRELHALRRLDGHPRIVGFRGVAYSELEGDRMPALLRLLKESAGPRPVRLHVHHPGSAWTTHDLTDLKVIPDEPLMQGLETLFRRSDVPRLEC